MIQRNESDRDEIKSEKSNEDRGTHLFLIAASSYIMFAK